MKDFDISNNNRVEFEEFVQGILKWLNVAKQSRGSRNAGPHTVKFLSDYHEVKCLDYS